MQAWLPHCWDHTLGAPGCPHGPGAPRWPSWGPLAALKDLTSEYYPWGLETGAPAAGVRDSREDLEETPWGL